MTRRGFGTCTFSDRVPLLRKFPNLVIFPDNTNSKSQNSHGLNILGNSRLEIRVLLVQSVGGAHMLHLPHLSRPHYVLFGGTLLLLIGLALATSIGLSRTDAVTLPTETVIHVTLNQTVASNQNRPGDHFEAAISKPVIISAKTVIPTGASVEGLVVDAHSSGRLSDRARLLLALESVTINDKTYDIRTTAQMTIGHWHNQQNLGTGAPFLTGKKEVRLPPGTPVTFTLAVPVTIHAKD